MASSISSSINSSLRLSGMSSGLDTDSIIKQLMAVEKTKVDKAKQAKQRLEWKKDDYREITNLLRTFKDEYFNVTKSASNMRSASVYQKYTADYGGTTGIVTAVGGADVSDTSHTIKVTQLATAASATSTEQAAGISTSSALSALGVTDGTLTINGKTISYSSTDTIAQLTSRVNSSGAGVTLSYSNFLKKFTFTSNETGANGDNIAFSDTAGTSGFLVKAGFNMTDSTPLTGGLNAEFTLDGKPITSTDNYTKNTFTVDGVTYTLQKADPATTVSVNLTQDTETIYKSITAFVDQYNAIMEKLNSELSEEKYSDYAPLTDDEREAMSETEIELWEKKAKSGSLRNDSLLKNVVIEMRNAVANAVEGISGTLASIGISTGDYRDKGKLLIDETKLKTALQNTPNKVIDLFTQESSIDYSPNLSAADRATRDKQNGIANRLYDILQDSIRTTRDANGNKGVLLEKAGLVGDASEYDNTMDDMINDKDDLIDILIDKMNDKEDYYYAKFTAMETALSKMNSQSSWLTQQLGSGG